MTLVDRSTLADEDFRESCRRAFRSELVVAYTCVQAGAVHVVAPNYRITPSFAERGHYRDDGDLRVRWHHGGRQHFYEVKHPNVTFTSLADHPYPNDIFVDEVANLAAKDPRPDGYFICNAALTVAVFINLNKYSDDDLRIVTKFDRRYSQNIEYYAATFRQARCVTLHQPTMTKGT